MPTDEPKRPDAKSVDSRSSSNLNNLAPEAVS